MQGGNGAKMCKPQLGILGGIRGFKLVSNCAFQRLQQGRPKAAKHASWRNTVFKGNFESEQNAMSGICYTASPLQRFISTLREVTRVIGALFEPRRSSGARHIVAA